MQPNIVEYAAAHRGHRQDVDVVGLEYIGVCKRCGDYKHDHQQWEYQLPFRAGAEISDRPVSKKYQQQRADDMAAEPERPPEKVVLFIIGKGNIRKEGCGINGCIRRNKQPRPFYPAEKLHEHTYYHGSYAVAVDGCCRPSGYDHVPVEIRPRLLLYDQSQYKQNADKHYAFVIFAYVLVDDECKDCPEKLETQGDIQCDQGLTGGVHREKSILCIDLYNTIISPIFSSVKRAGSLCMFYKFDKAGIFHFVTSAEIFKSCSYLSGFGGQFGGQAVVL